jgi:hypothetical protein
MAPRRERQVASALRDCTHIAMTSTCTAAEHAGAAVLRYRSCTTGSR